MFSGVPGPEVTYSFGLSLEQAYWVRRIGAAFDDVDGKNMSPGRRWAVTAGCISSCADDVHF